MKKTIMLRILSVILSLTLILGIPVEALSASSDKIQPIDVINQYRTNQDVEYSIANKKTLKSISSDSYEYTLYELLPYGYAILFNETNSLMEACYSENANAPIDIDNEDDYYYGGPSIYCQKNSIGYLNAFNRQYLDQITLTEIIQNEINAQAYEIEKANNIEATANTITNVRSIASVAAVQNYSVEYNYFSNLTDYGTNTQGSCTIIAIAMLLGYYDNFANDKFVNSQYESGSGTNESFHQLLNRYVYGGTSVGGIFIHEASLGIYNYLDSCGISCRLRSTYSSQADAINKAISKLREGHPVVASMGTSQGGLYNHTVLVYRVSYNPSNPTGSAVFTMNMGWHGGVVDGQSATAYVASAGWFYECGYVESTCSTHSLTSWRDYNAEYHWQNCSNCNYVCYERHAVSWNQSLGKCTKCGRTDYIVTKVPNQENVNR